MPVVVLLTAAVLLAGCTSSGRPARTTPPTSPAAAHNAFVRTSQQARNAQRAQLGARLGVCYQTDFYPRDRGRDWACAMNVRAIAVLVQTVDTTGTFDTVALATEVLRHV